MQRTAFLLSCLLLTAFMLPEEEWLSVKHGNYTLFYTATDKDHKKEYLVMLDKGMKEVKAFTGSGFPAPFYVRVHPSRHSLDKQWEADWKMPGLRSECWMVASGVSGGLDLLSTYDWEKEACDHDVKDKDATYRVLLHELFHVYHAQQNPSPDFSGTDKLDWFIEGFATYASGQCDKDRLEEVKKLVNESKCPSSLDDFWTGKMKYGLSGSVMMYIDKTFGRARLQELLPLVTKQAVLNALGLSEAKLLKDWKAFLAD